MYRQILLVTFMFMVMTIISDLGQRSTTTALAQPYSGPIGDGQGSLSSSAAVPDSDDIDYYGVVLANLLNGRSMNYLQNEKRSCIRRGGPCDHRPNDCCPKSSCRCNLWGTNCRCHRLGLFQKWGKK